MNNKADPSPGFGVYFHWPFCRKKCPYCDFNSHVQDQVDQKRWTRALIAEFGHFAAKAKPKPVTSIFFGGGTPSLMAPETVSALISAVQQNFGLAADVEITLEANPTSVEAASFAGFRAAGVNRLSMGVQSLHDNTLAFLGREHSTREALAAVEIARRQFERISFDLIYALPGQSEQQWRQDLRRALDLAGDHLSLYQLTIEPNTGFAGALRRGEFQIPDQEQAGALFDVTQEICEQAGMPAYEISNHARPGQECRHNLTYWRYGEYLGIGPGAHGRIAALNGRAANRQKTKPALWLEDVERQGHGTAETHILEQGQDIAEELLLMGLRLREGVWFRNFTDIVGKDFAGMFDPDRISLLRDAGFIDMDQDRLWATDRGRPVLNSVITELVR